MCGNTSCIWFEDEDDGIKYFGADSLPEAWLGKIEPEGNEFRWTYGFIDGVALTGTVAEEEIGREIIDTFQQALDLSGEFAICNPAAG